MAQTDLQLFQKLTSLSQTCPNLGTRLSQAATELQKTGTPPSATLLEELTTYCRDFNYLRDRALEVAQESQKTPPFQRGAGGDMSLQDLENLLKASASSTDDIRQKALTILEGIGAIAHQDDPNFPPLQSAKAKARELQQAIDSYPSGQLHPEAKALAEKTHPLAALLSLIQQQEELDDDEWLTLEEKVGASFGKKLVVAISRGKLTANKIIPPASPKTAPPTIKLPSLEELEKPEVPPQVAPPIQKPAEKLPPLIVVPPGGATSQVKVTQEPDVMILEAPSSSEDLDEVIILPGLEVSKPSFGEDGGSSVGLKVLVHLQGIGDRVFSAYEYAGTRGQGLRIEAFQINLDPPIPGLSLQYMAHISGIGDSAWLDEGTLAGERGRSLRIEGFAMRLTGTEVAKYDLFYTAHIQNMGDSAVYSNGQYCGTRGKFLRVEGMKVWIQQK